MPAYDPPILDRVVRLRNLEDEADQPRNDQGEIMDPLWGTKCYAHRRDRAPFSEVEEGVEIIRAGRSVFTIRYRGGIAPNSEVVEEDGTVYILQGRPVERGGAYGGLTQKYLELHCEARSALPTPAQGQAL